MLSPEVSGHKILQNSIFLLAEGQCCRLIQYICLRICPQIIYPSFHSEWLICHVRQRKAYSEFCSGIALERKHPHAERFKFLFLYKPFSCVILNGCKLQQHNDTLSRKRILG